jgi:2-aminoethylphosphonate transport system permease protein
MSTLAEDGAGGTAGDAAGDAPTFRHLSRSRWGGVSSAGPLAALALFIIYPLIITIRQSFEDRAGRPAGLTAWRLVLQSGAFAHALATTVELAVMSAACCVVLGTFFAITLAFVPFPGSALMTRILTTTLAFPSFFIALSFSVLYSRTGVVSVALGELFGTRNALGGFLYTPGAVLLAEVTFYLPFVLRPVLAASHQMPAEHLQVAASLGARPLRVLTWVVLPELTPAILAGAFTCLLLTLNEFGIVLFIGAKGVLTLPVLIYVDGIVSFDYPSAAVLASVQVVLSMALYAGGRLALRHIGGNRADLD